MMNLALNSAFWQTACYTVVLMPYNVPTALCSLGIESANVQFKN